jgi:hypothetical protein
MSKMAGGLVGWWARWVAGWLAGPKLAGHSVSFIRCCLQRAPPLHYNCILQLSVLRY